MSGLLRSSFDKALVAATAGLALWALAALGGSISDNLDVLTHFAPLALAGALALLAAVGLLARPGRERYVASLLALAAAVWSFTLMAPELLAAARPPPPAAGRPLKLVQFNVWANNTDPQASADWLLKTEADVLLLQEIDGPSAEALVARLRADYPYGSVCEEARCSLALLSRWPVRNAGIQRQHRRDAKALSAAWAEIEAPGGVFTALTTHYTWPTSVHAQELQRAELMRLVRRHRQDDLIVTGDFNLTPWSKALHEQDARLGLIRRTRAVFSWPTVAGRHRLPSPLPLLPIDHVYAGPAWRTVAVERGPRLGSDHYPVIVTLVRTAR